MEPAEAVDAVTALTQQLTLMTQAFQEMQASHEHLLQRVATQEQRIAECTALPPSTPPTLTRTLEVVSSEPSVSLPERFSGDRRKYRSFIISCELLFSLKPRTYATDFVKIRTAIFLLAGPPQTWVHQLLQADDPVLASWESFAAALQRLYDDPLRSSTSRGTLRTLRQGRRLVEDYIMVFREVAPA
ncbi:PREDICTED: protein LDOC1L-like [Nanorana parkeri]|uniref:protein LDOC1L-like n=1 Tax=Nanorana parkeri TaxID=125878 RepID=UPI0008544E20|nr:PREDICTED: protein LDOC1L-like [Nanorana parkeri]